MHPERIPCIGGPLHGKDMPIGIVPTLMIRTCGPEGEVVHRYQLERYVNGKRHAYFWIHPDATDAQIDHALGLADI